MSRIRDDIICLRFDTTELILTRVSSRYISNSVKCVVHIYWSRSKQHIFTIKLHLIGIFYCHYPCFKWQCISHVHIIDVKHAWGMNVHLHKLEQGWIFARFYADTLCHIQTHYITCYVGKFLLNISSDCKCNLFLLQIIIFIHKPRGIVEILVPYSKHLS